ELHDGADPAADDPDGDPDGEPGEEPAVDVRGAVPLAEPDAAQGDPQRSDLAGAVGRVPRRRLRPCGGRHVRGRPPPPPGTARGFRLNRRLSRPQSKKKGPAHAGPFSFASRRRQFVGSKLNVRRLVTGELIGWKRQRSIACSASRSKIRGGEALTTRE